MQILEPYTNSIRVIWAVTDQGYCIFSLQCIKFNSMLLGGNNKDEHDMSDILYSKLVQENVSHFYITIFFLQE